MNGQNPQLRAAPVVQAVLDFRVATSRPYALIPGAVAAALEGEYPNVAELPAARIVGLFEMPPEAGLVVMHQLRSSDGNRLIQLGPAGISVHVLGHYPGFSTFRALIAKALDVYLATARIERVVRLGLRYINAIAGIGPGFDDLAVRLAWPQLAGAVISSVAARAVYDYHDPPGQMGVAVAAPNDVGQSLDLDFFSILGRVMTRDEVLTWIDAAHQQIYDAFVAAVAPDRFDSWR